MLFQYLNKNSHNLHLQIVGSALLNEIRVQVCSPKKKLSVLTSVAL
jgi:hypothetical protein